MGAITSEWAPLAQSGLFICIISCHFQFGPLLVNSIAGELCDSWLGWQSTYYIFGTTTLLAIILFFLFFRDSPHQHCWISDWERGIIEEGKKQICESDDEKEETTQQQQRRIPYFKMLTDFVIWGILISNVGATFGNQIFNTLGPTFLKILYPGNTTKRGFLAALPFLLAIGIKLMAGPLSDWIGTRMSEKARVILFTSISQYVMAALFIIMALIIMDHENTNTLIIICYTTVTAFAGLWQVGVVKCAQLTARHFSSSIFSWNTFVSYAIVLILPALASLLAPKQIVEEWAWIFGGIALIQVLTTTFFNLTARVEPRPWTLMGEMGGGEEKAMAKTAAEVGKY